jgi:hypothetical protein
VRLAMSQMSNCPVVFPAQVAISATAVLASSVSFALLGLNLRSTERSACHVLLDSFRIPVLGLFASPVPPVKNRILTILVVTCAMWGNSLTAQRFFYVSFVLPVRRQCQVMLVV